MTWHVLIGMPNRSIHRAHATEFTDLASCERRQATASGLHGAMVPAHFMHDITTGGEDTQQLYIAGSIDTTTSTSKAQTGSKLAGSKLAFVWHAASCPNAYGDVLCSHVRSCQHRFWRCANGANGCLQSLEKPETQLI